MNLSVPTVMHVAFDAALRASTNPSLPLYRKVKSAVKRGVGLTRRKTMWSVQRGKR